LIVRDDHALARRDAVPLAELADVPIVIHPRHANPGRYDRIDAACRAAGFAPRFEEPLLAFDPTHAMIKDGQRVTIVSDPGDGVPHGLRWIPITPALTLDVVLLTPLVARAEASAVAGLVAAAAHVAEREGWLVEPADSPSELRVA
jgi:hypothetical protein